MQQHELRQAPGATHKRKRVGRGNASGHGTYSGKGLKGQKARAGGGVRPGFEGGQLPLIRRMARKRGFRNPFRVDYEEVNVGQLGRFSAGAELTAQSLLEARIIRQLRKPVKILGNGEISVALTVEAVAFSKSARSKIESAGGTVRWLNGEPPAPEAAEGTAAAEAKPAKRKRARGDEPETSGAPATAEESGAKPKRASRGKKEDAESSKSPPSAEAGVEEKSEDGAGS